MAEPKRRNLRDVYEGLKKISQEDNVDFGIDNYTYDQFKQKYGTKTNLSILHKNLSQISDETGLDFGIGTADEWLNSFTYDGTSSVVDSAAPTAAPKQPVKPMGAAATLPSWKTSAMPDDVRKRFEQQEAQPLGPERFQKQMEMQQAVGAQMQSFNNKINAISENGKPFGKPIDALAPARQQRLQKEANDKLNESLNIATLGITQNTQPAREAWNQAGLRTQKDWRFGKLISNEASYLKNHDLDRMSEEAWNNIPTDRKQTAIRKVSQVLRGQNPELSYGEALQIAERIVRAKSDQMMYDMAVEQNAPKGWLDYLTRKINDNAIGSILEGVARHKAGTIGDMQAREEATQQYANDNWFGGLVGDVAAMTLAPEMWIGGGVAGGALKGGTAIAGRAAGKAAVREGMSTLAGRMATKGLTSGVNLATFNAIGEAAGQAKHGGKIEGVDEETGRYVIGDYSLGDVGKSALHGLGLGVVTGPTGELIGNVGTKLVNRTASTAGKAAIRGSQALASTVAEGTIFVAPEILSGDITFDDWKHSVEMMAAFKLQGGLKSAKERIAELRGKRENSRQGFETRLRTMLDKSPNLALTKDEKAELERGGYKDLVELSEGYKNTTPDQRKAIETRQPIYLEPNENGEIPLNRFIDLVEDKNISEAARAKMYYYVTGHGLPQHTIVGSNFTEHTDDKGNTTYNVQSFSRDNGIVTSRTFKNKKEAENELARINRQAELNGVDMGEKHYNDLGDAERMKDAYDIVAEQKGISGEALRRKLNRKPEEMDETEKAWAKEVQQAYDNLPQDAYKTSDDVRKAINSEYDVDVDDVLKKERARRTEKEQEALEEYTKRLFADVMPKEGQSNGTNDATRLLKGSGYEGVQQRINDDADIMAAQQREEAKKKQFRGEGENKGALRPVKIKQQNGEPREVFLTQGEIVLTDSGLVDPEKTKEVNNVGTLTGYDPATGEEVQFTPADIVEVEPMTTAEQQEQNIEANKQAYIQQQMAAATPTATTTEPTATTTDPKATTSATTADNQQQEPAPAKPKGKPKELVPGMTLTVTDRDGNEHIVTTDGERYNYNPVTGELTESENGNYLKLTDKNGDVLSYDLSNRGLGSAQEIKDYEMPKEEQPTETVEPTEQPTAEVPTAESITPQQQVTPEPTPEPAPVEKVDPMDAPIPTKMVERTRTVKDKDGNKKREKYKEEVEDFSGVSAERAYKYYYVDNADLYNNASETDKDVAKNLKDAEDNLNKLQAKLSEATGSVAVRRRIKDELTPQIEAAQNEVQLWKDVQAIRENVKREEMKAILEEQQRKDAERHDAAVAQREADMAEAEAKRAEQERTGANAAQPIVRERWNASPKIEGFDTEFNLPNGETIDGRYVLVESGAATPSHDPANNFTSMEGYPVDENGNNINDRDYQRSPEAMEHTRNMAANYDGRALQSIPVVSREGVVLSGNGRTMAGMLAAQDGTDGVYKEKLKKRSREFGFTPEQVEAMQHPRVVFVPNEDMPYTTETLAKFNESNEKQMSPSEKAFKYGKMVDNDTFSRIMRTINGYTSLADFYADRKATDAVLGEMTMAGIYNKNDVPSLYDGEKLSESTKADIESILIGKFFEKNPDMVNMIVDMPAVRQKVVKAMQEIADNANLGKDYSLQQQFADAVKLVYDAKNAGSSVADHAKQYGIDFETGEVNTAADINDLAVLRFADVLTDKSVNKLKDVFTLYNDRSRDAAQGQSNLFADNESGVQTREEILKEVINTIYHGRISDIREETDRAARRRQAESNAEADASARSNQGQPAGEPAEAVGEQPAGEVAEKSESKEEVKGETNEADAELDALIADYKEKQAAVNKIWNNWLKDKSGAPAKYGNSREIEQEAYNKIRKALRNVSDEQLDGLAKRLADDNLLMFLIEGEQNRREENRERANEFPNGIAEQGDISKESKPVKTAKILPDFTSRDPQHPVQNCIYYDPDGHAVATDGHVLIASKSQYDPKQKGKMVAAHKVKGAAEKGDVLEGKFPNWKSVIPAESEQKTKINLRKLANFLAGTKDIMKGEKEKESSVIVRMPNGDIVGFDPDNLQKFVQAADAMGVKEVEYGSFDKPLIGRSNDGIVVVMPKLIGTSYDGKKFYYDLSDGSIKEQKTGGEATKTSKRDRRLLEVVMDKLRNIIGDRLHTTLTEDEKRMINWANAKTKGTAPVFYSNAERAVEGIKQEKATAEQWLAMIQKAGGLKAGEDKWMGLSEWLNDHKGKSLTKQEVLDFIRDNQIRMEEVNYAEDGDYPNYAEEMATRRELVAFEDEMSEKYGNGWENKLNEAERLRFENLNSSLENYKKSESRPINDTRLKYTTDFLDNKREIAFVVPNIESWHDTDEVHFGDAGNGRAVAWVRFGDAYMPADGGAARQEFERIMKDNDEWYAAHPMFAKYGIADKGENLDALNKESEERKARQREALAAADAVPKTVKVLVIDEIQSNRHQEGREKGYKDNSKDKAMSDYTAMLYEKYGPQFNVKLTEEEDAEYSRLQRERMQEEKSERVPDAPFEKNWHEVAFKRMLRYAAENGYDKVAWTTGEQQAKRYSLSQKVKEIAARADGNGNYYVVIEDKDGQELMDYRGAGKKCTAEEVINLLGKDLGGRLIEGAEKARGKEWSGKGYNPEFFTIREDGLEVGGEGMKGFYDQILPRFMDKYGKKWGVKTTDVELPNIGDNGLTMHSVEVTPEMKKSVLEGQPMFHKVFHGSGALLKKKDGSYVDPETGERLGFDSAFMGTGEGNQAYGYGHYTTEVEGIGRTYAKAMGQYEYQGRKYNNIRDNWKGDDATQRVVLDVLKYLDKDNDTRSVQEAIDFSIKVKELRIARKIGDVEEAKRELDALKNLSVEDFKTSATLYTVEIPDDNGSNYLEWNGKLSNEKVNALQDDLLKDERFMSASRRQYDEMGGDRIADDFPSFEEWVRNHAMVVAMSGMESGQRLYKELSNELGGDKAASEFLHNAGFVGIKYPAQYRSGGREDNAKNYVIFDDGDLKIIDKVKFFKTPQGEVYGFTVGGNIYVDMDIAKADTPIHEYGHLWVPMVRESDPEMWEDIKRVLTKDKDVKPFMDIVRQRYPELTAEGREDDFMEEVFTHFSGDNGLKMLEEAAKEYEEQDGQGIISKAKAIAALNKVKEALDKFWGKVAQLFGIKFRNAREVANKMFKDFMDEVDPTKVRTERIKNEGLKPEEEKTLMGVHNISEEKLRKALKNGGFANPSMAVIDTKNGGFDSYGDISLIPRSSLIDARTGRNAGTYSGDAYTPIYPNVEYYEGKETEKKLQELTSSLPQSIGEYIRRKVSNYMDRNSNNSGLEYLFLKEHGVDMPIVHNERRYPGISTKQIAERMGVSEYLYGSDLYNEYKKMPEDQRFDFNLWLQHYGNEEDIAKVKNLIAEMQEKGKEKEANYLIDHYTKPMNFAHFDSTVYNISRDEREAGEENLARTVEDAAMEVNKQDLRNEFDAWQQKVIDGLGYEEKLFAGYTPSGYRKYLPNTAENASKLMNKQEDTNAGNDTGLNATRSALLYKMQSLDDIRQHRDLLQGNDAYGERQSEMTDELLDLAHQLSDMQKIDDNPFINTDYAILRMQDAFTKKDPIGYLNKEYGYSIDKDSEFAKQMLDFMNDVRDLPAKYFETKFKRPVALDEFAVAVVPEGTSQDVVDALKNAGLDVRTYDGTSENRQAVTLEAVRGRDDIMFQKADNKSTEREVEPYKAPKRNDGEDLVDYAKRVAEDYEEYKKRNEKPVDAGNGKGNDGNGNGNGGNVTVDKNDVPRAVARDSYERMMDSGANQFKEAVQDSMLSLKKLYEAILGKGTKIEDVEGYKNAYLAENRMHSASQAEIGMWHKDFMEPVVKAIHELTGGKRTAYDDLVKYMMAKHGLERNAVFAERDAQAAAKKGADYDDELQKNRGRDYAGLTALTGEDDVANAEGMAQKMVDDYEADHDTTELWNAINRATKQSLWKLASSGMMTPERYNEIRDMFSYYIPLQGFDETVAENVYSYMGNDGTIGYGTPIRHARGRKSLADDPIATMAMNGEAAIRQANRNEMKKRFLAFAQEHPSDLVSVSEVWLKHNDVTGEWEQVTADLNENDSPADVERKTREFDEKMEQLASNDPDHYKKASDIPNVPFRVVEPSDMKQHQVLVQRGGKKYMLTINGNPRAAQALNGLTNPDVFTEGVFGKAMNLGQWLNRQLSAFYTTRNPEFVLSNFLRDAIYSNSMSWVKESPNYALKFHKNFGKMNPVHMGKLFAQWENGKLRERIKNGTASETDQLFYDFMTNGGETGWTSLRDIEKHKKELQSSLKREGSTSRKAWKALGEAFDLMNRSVENCARFAAFVTSREMGRSIDRSISDAKEVSVNFNKKGAGDKFLTAKNQNLLGKVGASMGGLGRGLYVFFNASMQGLNNIARATKRHPGKAAGVYSTLFALGALAPILAEVLSGGDDDDDKNAYYNLPEYIRRSNICFRFGKDMPWITIPLPIEFRAIYGLGELSTGALTGKEHYTDEEFAKQYVSQLSQVLPLDFMEGGGGWHAFVPSMIKPYVEAQSNTSWTGLPIYRDNTFKPYDPEWTRAYSSANKQLVDATKWLNEATGGDDVTKGFIDWNPAKIEYMLKGYLGGYFTMYDRLQKTAETALGNRDFEWRNIPMASRVLREGDERTEARKLTNEYFDLVDEYNYTKHKVKEYEKISKSDREDAIKYAQKLAYLNNSEEYTRYLLMEYYKPILDQFHDMVKEADGEQSKRIKGEENALRRELINIIHSIDDGAEIDVDAAIDEMLMGILNDEQSDISLRKKAQNTIKKHRKAMAASQQ